MKMDNIQTRWKNHGSMQNDVYPCMVLRRINSCGADVIPMVTKGSMDTKGLNKKN